MRSSILFYASFIASAAALPAPQAPSGTIALGETCSSSAECANGANCYSVNSGLIRTCGNFQAACTSDSQCAFNTCQNGLCSGFKASASAASAAATEVVETVTMTIEACPAPAATTTAAASIPVGGDCTPGSTPCADGANCYAVNSMLQTVCGNFQASCTSDSQCAFNTCNNGLCNGFKPSGSSSTSSAPAPTTTPTTLYLPVGSECNPKSTPCANGSSCYAVNSGLQPVCGNFQAVCTSDDQCAFNTCQNGSCSGFKATTSAPAVTPTP